MNLRRVLLVSTAFSTLMLAGANAALAQDYDWSGFYIGVGVGAAASTDGGTLSWFDPENAIWDNTNITGGSFAFGGPEPYVGGSTLADFPGALSGVGLTGSVGFNAEMDNFLVGIEASVMTGPFKSEATVYDSGTVSYVTSTESTSYTYNASSSTYYTTSAVFSTTYLTYSTTVTNGVTTSTYLTTESTSTYQYTTTTNGTTIEYPTITSGATNFVSSSTYSTSDTTWLGTTTLGSTTVSYTTDGEWRETITGRAQIDWLATIKGRVGITADRALFFVSGGLAVGQVTQETSAVLEVDGTGGTTYSYWHGENTETKFGFVVGAGAEFAIDDHWILTGEAEYYNLGTAEYTVEEDGGGATGSGIYGTQTQTLDGGSVKVGIKFKMN